MEDQIAIEEMYQPLYVVPVRYNKARVAFVVRHLAKPQLCSNAVQYLLFLLIDDKEQTTFAYDEATISL